MSGADVPAEIAERRICADCVGDPFLGNEIDRFGEVAPCFYCNGEGKTFSNGEMADRTEAAVDQHFEVTARDPDGLEYAMMKEGAYEWYRKGQPVREVIQGIAAINPAAAEDIRLVLKERHGDFDRDAIQEEGP